MDWEDTMCMYLLENEWKEKQNKLQNGSGEKRIMNVKDTRIHII